MHDPFFLLFIPLFGSTTMGALETANVSRDEKKRTGLLPD